MAQACPVVHRERAVCVCVCSVMFFALQTVQLSAMGEDMSGTTCAFLAATARKCASCGNNRSTLRTFVPHTYTHYAHTYTYTKNTTRLRKWPSWNRGGKTLQLQADVALLAGLDMGRELSQAYRLMIHRFMYFVYICLNTF